MKQIILILCAISANFAQIVIAQTSQPIVTNKPTSAKTWEVLRQMEFQSWEKSMEARHISHSRAKTEQADSLPFNADYAPFYHGVASGDPLSDRVVIWTRITPPDEAPISGIWQVASNPEMTNIVQNGTFTTDALRDYTVKIDVSGLQAGNTYYYNFRALGTTSLTGRTRTTPTNNVERLRFGVVSCSHYQQGYFNAYGRVADRLDLDAVIHLGDYIYEYGVDDDFADGTRLHEPATEIISLSDYRTRHSLYKLDPDLRRAHQQHPFITIWDDHEVANNAWLNGASNHNPSTEGDYAMRKQNAIQAYFEWMPIREPQQVADRHVYRTFHYGNLADLIMIDTRHEGRDEQLPSLDDPNINNLDRTLLGTVQYEWLKDQLEATTAQWKIIGNQVVISPINTLGVLPNTDMWDGYPAERAKVVHVIDSLALKNMVFITGDIHLGIAADATLTPQNGYDPNTGATSFGVEFVTTSISSANDEAISLPLPTETIEAAALGANPHAKYLNISDHGYLILDVAADKVQSDWYSVESRDYPTTNENFEAARYALDQVTHLVSATAPMPSLPNPPAPAPELITAIEPNNPQSNPILLIAVYPNPVDKDIHIHYALAATQTLQATLHDINGKQIAVLSTETLQPGIYTLKFNAEQLPEGAYLCRLSNDKNMQQAITRKIIVKHQH